MGRLTHRIGPGFTYFVTTKCWQNRAVFQVGENAQILIECMLRYRDRGAFALHDFVLMPNHLHLILTPATNTSLEKAMQLIKGGSSHEIHQRRELRLQIWQAGFHEESIRDLADYLKKAEYIRMNPVRARLVERSEDWQYGSACGHHGMDSIPERLNDFASAAKAAVSDDPGKSELKLRPPKRPQAAAPELRPAEHATRQASVAKASVTRRGSMLDVKVRPSKNLPESHRQSVTESITAAWPAQEPKT
ncbi:MAG: REP-associated tyrosine transposase [Candidatus Acidiferrales bacterium]